MYKSNQVNIYYIILIYIFVCMYKKLESLSILPFYNPIEAPETGPTL